MVNLEASELSQDRVSKKHHPSFFQPFVQHKNSINLRIPHAFVKNFHGNIPFKISLKNMSELVWPAKLCYMGDHLHITSGWEQFVKGNSLNSGDILVFHYVPDSTFLVMAFDSDGCNKGAPQTKKKRNTIDRGTLQFERTIGTTHLKKFVTVPNWVLKYCAVKIPERVELSFEEGVSMSTWLREQKDRAVLGYAGMGRFWKLNNVKKGDKLQFQIICGKGKTVKKIVVRRVQESPELGRGYY